MRLAPIAIFAFNRPNYLQSLLESLELNAESSDSEFFVFIDGPRNSLDLEKISQVNHVLKNFEDRMQFRIFSNEKNIGLSASLLKGIDKIFDSNLRVIVLEDDLIVGKHFLEYCNSGLELYEDYPKIASIQGFTLDINHTHRDTYFLAGADCWGWATWRNRWDELERDGMKLINQINTKNLRRDFDLQGAYPYSNMLERQAKGELDSWAIRWHASMFLKGRLSIYPSKTLVENLGQDGSGIHSGNPHFKPRTPSPFSPVLGDLNLKESAWPRFLVKKALRKKYGTHSFLSPRKYTRYLARKINERIKRGKPKFGTTTPLV